MGVDPIAQVGLLIGVVTKGLGVGADVTVKLGVDLTALISSQPALALCNMGEYCKNCQGEANHYNSCTSDADCTDGDTCYDAGDPFLPKGNTSCEGSNDPSPCCAGAGTGSCYPPVVLLPLTTNISTQLLVAFPTNDDCIAADNPYLCCTAATAGTCH